MPVVTDQRPEIDWPNCQRNNEWHDRFFAPKALKDHQAKGNCDSAALTLDYMVEKGWLKKGDVILDPMCGIGSFLIVAAMKGFNCIGVELERRFIDDMEGYDTVVNYDEDDLFAGSKEHVLGNLEHFRKVTADMPHVGTIHVMQGDARQLHQLDIPVDAVLCSPPYGNRLSDSRQQIAGDDPRSWKEISKATSDISQYGTSSANIGNAKIKVISSPPYKHGEHSQKKIDSIPDDVTGMYAHEYLEQHNIANIATDSKYSYEMLRVYKSLYEFLEPGAVVALVTRNFIQKKKVVQLDRLTIRLMQRAGFTYLETKRAANPEVSFFRMINHQKMFKKRGLPLIDWEEITFYRK